LALINSLKKRETQKKKKLAVTKGGRRRRESKGFSLFLMLDRKWRLHEREGRV
jgi:hypothetical protein